MNKQIEGLMKNRYFHNLKILPYEILINYKGKNNN